MAVLSIRRLIASRRKASGERPDRTATLESRDARSGGTCISKSFPSSGPWRHTTLWSASEKTSSLNSTMGLPSQLGPLNERNRDFSAYPIPIWGDRAVMGYLGNHGTLQVGDRMGMINPARQHMTLLVFLGVVLSLLILRLIPGLLLRLVLAIPRRRLVTLMASTAHGVRSRRIGIVLQRKSASGSSDTQLVFQPSRSKGRVRRVLVSSSLLAIAVLVTTAFWSWHSTGLMMLLR